MSTGFLEYINSTSETVVSAGAGHLLQSVMVAMILALVDFTFGRRLGPQWRCALWLIFFVKLALPPHLALPCSPAYWLPRAPAASEMPVAAPLAAQASAEPWAVSGATDHPVAISSPRGAVASASGNFRPAWQSLTIGAWAAGALTLGLATFMRSRRLRSALGRSTTAPAYVETALARAEAALGCRPRCQVRLADAAVGPLVAGLWRPTIYLPRQLADELPAEQLHAVLVHELLHVKRGDLWVTAIQTAARIFFFYNPAVWWVNAHLARLREVATDRAVLAHPHVDAHDYSLALVAAAELGISGRPVSPFALGVIETKSQLRKRIHMNLNQPRARRAGLGRSGLLSLALLGLVVLPMAPAGLAESESQPRVPAGFQPLDAAATVRRIESATEQIFAAFNRRDREAYVAAFAPDVQIMIPGQPLQTGRAGAAEGYLQTPSGLIYDSIRWKDRVCYQVGKWLIETGLAEFRFRLSIDAPVMADPRQVITIWEEDETGRLQVKVLTWNPLPRPPDFSAESAPMAFAPDSTGAALSTNGEFGAVLQAEDAVHRAFEQMRMSDAADFYATDAILFHPETRPLRGHAAIRHYVNTQPPERCAQRIERTVAHVEGNENHVLVVNLFRWTFTLPGTTAPLAIAGKGVHLWVRTADGSWKILLDLPSPSQST